MSNRWDVVYRAHDVIIEPHFCREWNDNGGCYGTDPNHGYSFDEACDKVAEWYEEQAKQWRDRTHWQLDYYKEKRC